MIGKMNPLTIMGLAFLFSGVLGTGILYPLATIRFGALEVIGISSFSAVNTFIGLVLIFFSMRKRRYSV